MIKVFISHSTKNKIQAINLSNALKKYNIDAFVAHEHIECNDEWLKTIKQKLAETDIAIALITEDFNKSAFCQQEVGYILGKNANLISVMLDDTTPQALIGDKQGIKANKEFAECLLWKSLHAIYNHQCFKKILEKVLGKADFFNKVEIVPYIDSFNNSDSYANGRSNYETLFRKVEEYNNVQLSESNIDKIVEAFNKGRVNHTTYFQLIDTYNNYPDKPEYHKEGVVNILAFLNIQYKKLKDIDYNVYSFLDNICTHKSHTIVKNKEMVNKTQYVDGLKNSLSVKNLLSIFRRG